MIFIFSKVFLFLLRPIVWISILLLVALSSKRRKKQLLIAAILSLLFFSNNFIAGQVAHAYESSYPLRNHHDIGIVLGGYSSLNLRTHDIAFGPSSDRLFQAVKLLKAGNLKKILLSGGSANLLDTTTKESDLTYKFLRQIGIPNSSIWVENLSRNTVENAQQSIDMIHRKQPNASILVITSAWHIPRSRIIFDKIAKQKLDYYPTNFIGKSAFELTDFIIPDAAAFSIWDVLLKEWVGCLVDRTRA